MSHRREQQTRHFMLSEYCAEGNTEARDRMIASIERAETERQEGMRFMLLLASPGAVIGLILGILDACGVL